MKSILPSDTENAFIEIFLVRFKSLIVTSTYHPQNQISFTEKFSDNISRGN